MSGIAGWVDFGRDLAKEYAGIRAMTATMALRGPDGEGVWLDRHVALGHRRLATIDVAGGRQPMTVERGGAVAAVVTCDGTVYNYRELRDELRGAGHQFRTGSDTEVVLHAYLRWGDEFPQHLNGAFAIGLWDAIGQRLLLVRDRLGVRPLHYQATSNGVLFASEPKGIFAHPAADAIEVDADGLREALTRAKTPGRTIYRNIHEVLPGHLLEVGRGGTRQHRYWSFGAREHTDDLDTTVRTVRDLLADSVARQMIADVPLCTLLSGGLDSSAVTALACAARGADAERVRTFSVDYAGRTENFRPDPQRDQPDAPFIQAVTERCPVEHTDVMLDSLTLLDPLYRVGGLTAYDALPSSVGDMSTSLYLLLGAAREHATVVLTGEAADEVFGGYLWFHDQRFVSAPVLPWLPVLHGSPSGANPLTDVLDPGLASMLDLPAYEADTYRDGLAEVEHLPGEEPGERRMRDLFYLTLTRWAPILLDRKDRISSALGLEARLPFCDHRLVEYVYNTPWSMKSVGGREKSLLRAAVADLLPEPVLQRKKSPYPSTQDAGYERELRAAARAIIADTTSPVADLLDTKRLTEILDSPLESDGFAPNRRRADLVVALDDWLRRYPVRLRLG